MDLAMLDRISAPRPSPDGRYVAYGVSRTDWERNRGSRTLELVDLHSPEQQPVALSEPGQEGTNPRWSNDSEWLYFISSRSGSPQVWKTNVDGSVQHQVTSFPLGVADYRLGPNQRWLLVTIDAYSDCDSLACIVHRDEARTNKTGSGILTSSGPARYGDAYEDDKHLGLFRAELPAEQAPAEARRIVHGFDMDFSIDEQNLAISHDGATLFFASLDLETQKGAETSRNLYAMPSDGSTRPKRVLGGVGSSISGLALSPDGRRLAYLATSGSLWTFGRTTVMVLDLEGGGRRDITPDEDIMFRQLAWSSDGHKLLATALERGQGPLYEIDVATGGLTKLLEEGNVDDVNVAAKTTVYLLDSFSSPQQIFIRNGAGPDRRLSLPKSNMLGDKSLSEWEQFSFPGWNDELVYGFVMKPHGYVDGHSYPVAFLIHGGPQSSFSNSWSYRWNPQVWAGMGYAVVMIDFHGSTGYGEAFGLASVGHWGDRPLEDLRKGWAFVTSRYSFLDEDRACAVGGSYGGFMINWMASQWNGPWRCMVNHAGVFDTRFLDLAMSIDAFVNAQFGGGATPPNLEKFNPALHVKEWRAPMLITHGTRDFLVSIDQGISAYNAARRQGIPAQMLVFPDEGHQVLRPQNLVQWYGTLENWMHRWTAAD